jgi:hypothetical protein
MKKNDPINHPHHYTSHPSGVEVIQITEHENFCRGNAIKYILRAGKKENEIEDLSKAIWYLKREVSRLKHLGRLKKPFPIEDDSRQNGLEVLDNEMSEEQKRLEHNRMKKFGKDYYG